ncbi:PREDICTED: WPP domain-interacting protein 1-like [Ipomoea nil]|uniref:WPP domain-interacting protein 1-like n=1 Tax=Ipomoea nil TaxID=35883 RepID=UPI000900E736|nr:PREDICTED: WPP domain-interacting protein 1-like [Ipomoea nil]
MELERECSALESAQDNEAISNINAEKLDTNSAEQQVSNNGCGVAEQKQMNGKGNEVVEEAGDMPPVVDVKSTPIPMSTKGKGLRKWRRFKREARMDGDTNIDTSKMLKRGLSHSGGNNPAKPGHFSAGVMQKSEGSNSSTVAFMRSPGQLFDCFGGIGDTGAVNGPAFMAGTDSENSEGQSSRSSTAASAPKMRYTKPVVVEHGRDKNWVSLSGNSSVNSVQLGQKGKNKMESSKKPRGERDKIEIENSHSSMESDSRSSNFVFMRGTDFVTGNGTKEGRSMNYDGENSDEAEDSVRKESSYFQASYSRESNGGFGDFLQEGLAAEASWEAKNEKSENHGTSTDFDPLAESIFTLQTAQEALEKEVEKFKALGMDDVLNDDPLGNGSRPLEFTSDDHGPSTSDQWQSGDSVHCSFDSQRSEVISLKQIVKLSESKLVEARTMLKLKEAKISELEAIISNNSSRNEGTGIKFQSTGDIETEVESLFKQKLEADVELLVISKAVRNQKTAAQISLLEEQKALAKTQAEMANKNGCAPKKAALPNCEDERSQNYSENIVVTADETVKIRKEVFKYTRCFFLQLVLLVLVVGLFVLQLSPHQAEVIPT